jgi:hypothetical protein
MYLYLGAASLKFSNFGHFMAGQNLRKHSGNQYGKILIRLGTENTKSAMRSPTLFPLHSSLKGIVRPYWIGRRVVFLDRLWFGHPPLYVLQIIVLVLNIFKGG